MSGFIQEPLVAAVDALAVRFPKFRGLLTLIPNPLSQLDDGNSEPDSLSESDDDDESYCESAVYASFRLKA
jgi:hypothetical protein